MPPTKYWTVVIVKHEAVEDALDELSKRFGGPGWPPILTVVAGDRTMIVWRLT